MKRVVVIGAGAGGLSALRSLVKHKDKLSFVAYEQSDRVGGTWIHNDPYKPTSMYDRLRTNLPKEVMAFPGFPFSTSVRESFIGHKTVLEYLEGFAQHNELHQYIKFRHTVVEVDPDMDTDSDSDITVWNVTTRDEVSGLTATHQYDAVIVCNGHYSVPLMPDIDGLDTYSGKVIHSHYYRSPDDFKDKVVLVLGAGPSGTDIAIDMRDSAQKIFLSHNKKTLTAVLPDNVTQVAGISSIAGEAITLRDGEIVHADVILLATGYRFTFPFLTDACHPKVKDEHVRHIYKFMVDIKYPSMYYIGLNMTIAPFPQFHWQTEYAVACITGLIPQKTKKEMNMFYANQYRCRVTNMEARDKSFHVFGPYQWHYNRELAIETNQAVTDPVVEELYEHVHGRRRQDLVKYKNSIYGLKSPKEFKIIFEPSHFQSFQEALQEYNHYIDTEF